MAETARFLSAEERESLYPTLLEQCFGTPVSPSGVSTVGVIEDDDGEVKSFMAGYWHSATEFYIKFTGVMPCARTRKGSPAKKYLLDGMRFFKARFYRTRHVFGDTVSQRVLADTKFFVHGSHVDTAGHVWIDWIKDMGEIK